MQIGFLRYYEITAKMTVSFNRNHLTVQIHSIIIRILLSESGEKIYRLSMRSMWARLEQTGIRPVTKLRELVVNVLGGSNAGFVR